MGELVGGLLPVAQALGVAMAGMLIAKPSIIEQEHVYTQAYGIAHQLAELLFAEVKVGGLPVVEQGHAVALAILQLVTACPVM